MSEMKKYPPGTFCWVELATIDAKSAKAFYGELLDWRVDQQEVPGGIFYSMMKYKGKDVAGLYEITAEMKSQGVPPNWLSYVSVASADETSAKAKSLGGTVVKDPFEVMDFGRMAVIQDPTKAMFALWQPRGHQGAALVNEAGAFCWNELLTTDTAAAEKFCTALFGWSADHQELGPMPYTMFMNGERMAAGMLPITEETGDVPPNWMVYFSVKDCDSTVERAKKMGATVLVPPMDLPEIGRMAALMDPQQAGFSVIKLENPQ
jgi:predicted enzyme related to lactoylglutathione lyase